MQYHPVRRAENNEHLVPLKEHFCPMTHALHRAVPFPKVEPRDEQLWERDGREQEHGHVCCGCEEEEQRVRYAEGRESFILLFGRGGEAGEQEVQERDPEREELPDGVPGLLRG